MNWIAAEAELQGAGQRLGEAASCRRRARPRRSRWPSASRQVRAERITSSLPWIARPTDSVIFAKACPNVWGLVLGTPALSAVIVMGAPSPSVSPALQWVSAQFVRPLPRSRSGGTREEDRGRPTRPSVVLMDRPCVAALDIGGTKIDAAIVDHSGKVMARRRHATRELADGSGEGGTGEALPDGEALFDVAAGLVEALVADLGVEPLALGVGCAGPMTPPTSRAPDSGAETVSPLNIRSWRGFPLRGRLEERLGIPTRVDNDAKAFALGEGRHGAALGVSNFVAMVVSTGVGGGIVLNGRLLDGAGGNAGHIGHIIVDPLGRLCPCGARGCLEAQVSGTAIAQSTGAPAAEASEEVRRRVGRLVGRAVGSVCNLLDIELAVVAGSVALGFGDLFFDEAQAELDRVARLEFSRGSRIVPTGCGPDGPLLGAAAVGWDLRDRLDHRALVAHSADGTVQDPERSDGG